MINDKGYLNDDLLNGEDIATKLLTSHNLVLIQAPDTSGNYTYINDKETGNYKLEARLYLYINSHPKNNQLYLINGYDGSWSRIYTQQANSINISFNSSTRVVTISANSECRGYLYQVRGLRNN